jgi:prolycopene isomerase
MFRMSTTTDGVSPHAIVIGAGIGGTALAALLAHAGLRVTLLEKNRYLGGVCAGYEKHGFHIGFGSHMFSRGERGPLGQVLKRVGQPGAIEFLRTDCPVELRWPDHAQPAGYSAVPFPIGLDPLLGARLFREMGLSPSEIPAVVQILAAGDADADMWRYRSLTEFIAHHTDNPRVAAMFSFLFALYLLVPPEQMSAGEVIHCFRRMTQDHNISYPRGGSQAVPLAYCRIAEDHGAQIHTGATVKRILITGGRAHGIELADGTRLDADLVISTSSVRNTALRLCDPARLPPSYVDRAKAVQGSLSVVQVKFALDTELVRPGCLIGAFDDTQDLLHAEGNLSTATFRDILAGRVPDALPFYCPVPTNFDPGLAPPGHQLLTACAPAPTSDIDLADPPAAWEEALTRAIRRIVPGLDEHILFVDRTTVTWMEHWNGKETGTVISTAQTPRQVGEHRPSVRTPVDGLYLAGDCAGGRGTGTELAADSAMECAEHVLTDLRRAAPASWRHADTHLASVPV